MESALSRVSGPLSQLASSLAGATTIDEVLDLYLKGAREVIPSRAVGIYLSRGAGKPPRALADGVSEYYLELYEELGRQLDPVLKAVVESGQAHSSSQMMSAEKWQASEFYQRVLSVHGFHATLKAPIVAQGRVIGTLNFGDRAPDAYDRPGDLDLATALGHIVGLSVTMATRLEDAERERLQLGQAFEASDDALIITDLRTGARQPNAAARQILQLLDDEDAALLLEDLLALQHTHRPPDGVVAEVRGGRHLVSVRPLPPGSDRKVLITRLTLRSAEASDTEVATFTQALLSPRERQIAAAVSLGLHDQQIADNLVLSVHTVKQHLKSIYRKLEVSSRVELTRLVLMRRGPDSPVVDDHDLEVT